MVESSPEGEKKQCGKGEIAFKRLVLLTGKNTGKFGKGLRSDCKKMISGL